MKDTNLIFFIFVLLFIGCSSTNTIKDSTSKEKFYEDFNKSVKDKNIKVTLTNDSLLALPGGAVIQNDTLFLLSQLLKSNTKSFPLTTVKVVRYKDRWIGLFYGLAIGTSVGILSAWVGIFPPFNHIGWDNYFDERVAPKLLKLIIFPVAGAILGFILGHNYNFYFN